MPVSQAQKIATAKYEKENYDKILVRFPKGTKERILNVTSGSVNNYIIQNILSSLEIDEGASVAEIEESQSAPQAVSIRVIPETAEIKPEAKEQEPEQPPDPKQDFSDVPFMD